MTSIYIPRILRELFRPQLQACSHNYIGARKRVRLIGPLYGHLEQATINERRWPSMSALLIEPILDRYVALVEKRDRDWSPREVEALLLKLREEVLQCLKT